MLAGMPKKPVRGASGDARKTKKRKVTGATKNTAAATAPGSVSHKGDRAQKTAQGTTDAKKEKALSLVGGAKKVSAADRTKAESLLAEIARRKERIAEEFYDIGLALRDLSKPKLFTALGYSSFNALLQETEIIGKTTAWRLIDLVSSMSRDEALSYGQEKAAALLEYAKATAEVDTPRTLIEGGKLPGGKKIADASVRDLKAGAKAARAVKGKGKPIAPEARAAAAEAKALAAWLRGRGASGVSAQAVRGTKGYVVRVEMAVAAAARLRAT